MNSSSCSDDNSETTTTTASTMSIGDNVHDKHVFRANLSALELKVMHVVSEITRLRSEMKRQASTAAKEIADLIERLERLEKEKTRESPVDPILEARVRSLEQIVINGQAPRSRGRTSNNLHSSLPDLSSTSAASAATRTRSRSRTRSMSNRVATAKTVSNALLQDKSNNDEEDLSMSFGLDFASDSDGQQRQVDKSDNEFPILSSPLRNSQMLSSFLSNEEDQGTILWTDNKNKSVSG